MNDIEIMNAAFVSSVSVLQINRSKYIAHIPYTGISNNFCSKATPIYGPGHNSEMNF